MLADINFLNAAFIFITIGEFAALKRFEIYLFIFDPS